jgi:hypothetical protein
MLVIPTCTLDRNLVGSDASVKARRAPERPLSASCTRRARRELTMAISDIAKAPLSRMRASSNRMSVIMGGHVDGRTRIRVD